MTPNPAIVEKCKEGGCLNASREAEAQAITAGSARFYLRRATKETVTP